MKVLKPDYSNSIVNISNSILKYFGASTYHEGLADLDALLEQKQYKHVVLMVNDGLGYENIQELLPEESFLRKHLVRPITSVFPPTTTAATTSLQSGLTPFEHGWLGWNVYVPQVDDIVTLFLEMSKTKGSFYPEPVAKKYLAYNNLYHKIPKETGIPAYGISPHEKDKYDFSEPDRMYEMIETFIAQDESNYIYAYTDQPDNLMHRTGTQSDAVKQRVVYINDKIEALSKKLSDTLIIVTADHGHIDVENLFLDDYPEIASMLAQEISIEPRAVNFFVKDEFKDQFESVFNKHLGEHFKLFSRSEVLNDELFGRGFAHSNFHQALGDFIAVSTSQFTLLDNDKFLFKGHHAGLTQREMLVPLILIECK